MLPERTQLSGKELQRAEALLEDLWAKGRQLLGARYSIMGGAMTWVSEHNLVAAMSNAGAFGVLATGSMSPAQLDAEIAATLALTSKPFGVNLITLHPQLQELIDVCIGRDVSHVVLAGGVPKGADVKRIKDSGRRVLVFAPAVALALRLARAGADGIIIEGSEAGGHIGPVATSVLAQEILPAVRDLPVFVAGGIGRGAAIAMYLEMGAAGCQLGTRFVCATESIAHPRCKQAFINAQARDAIPSVQVDPHFPVIPVRAIQNEGTRRFVLFQREVIDEFRSGRIDQATAQLKIEHFWAGHLRNAVINGDVENGSLMAGQSVGMVKSIQPTAEIVAELVGEAVTALARV
ncbi:MAG: 2-nitropropane dioxygenase [Alphaproteobacteria bacterium]|nr:2-nitropropane dioxygenase [Alphaproteobacteria bacterium]